MEHLDVDAAHQLIAGELAPAETTRWMTHIAGCEQCRALVERERTWSGLMRLGDSAAALPEEPVVLPDAVLRMSKPHPAPQALRAVVWLVIACLGAAGVGWQWARRPAVAASPPPLSEQERRAAVHQAELAVLLDDPWVETDLDTLLELDRLLGRKK